uniref:Uncharacterized protein n=1 Tax=Pygocentrus nattereri TaxID=42514 RepID=A0AAR2LQ81_PYGNA
MLIAPRLHYTNGLQKEGKKRDCWQRKGGRERGRKGGDRRERKGEYFPSLSISQRSHNATLHANKQRKATAMLGNASLFQVLPWKTVSVSRLSPCSLQPHLSNAKEHSFNCMWILQNVRNGEETTGETVAGHRLMSSVLNHRTAEWFYAYFICISLNPARLLSGNLPIRFNSTLIKKSGCAQPFKRGLIEHRPI